MNKNLDLLKSLCLSSGISGNEERIRNIIINEISNCDVKYYTDSLGNLIVFKKGTERPLTRLMITAHMDEVGFIVTHIDEKGYIGFEKVGSIDNKIIHGINVSIGDTMIPGVIGIKPIHLTKKSDLTTPISEEKLLIDIGAKDKDDASRYVNIGDPVVFDSIFDCSYGKIKSKALDDRAGCFILVNMIKGSLKYDTYFLFTVQEEIGLRGAMAASYAIDPQASIVIEATTANDLIGIEENKKICKIDSGPTVSFMDKRTIYDKEYYNLTLSIAKNNSIKAQPKSGVTGGNDAGAIHVSRCGIRTIALSVPCRYLHSPSCLISQSDLESTQNLAALLSENISSINLKKE